MTHPTSAPMSKSTQWEGAAAVGEDRGEGSSTGLSPRRLGGDGATDDRNTEGEDGVDGGEQTIPGDGESEQPPSNNDIPLPPSSTASGHLEQTNPEAPAPVDPPAPPGSQPPPTAPPHLDLAAFPPQELLKLLASLLQQIAQANDALRPDGASPAHSAAPTPASSSSSVPTTGDAQPRSSRSSTVDSMVIPPFNPHRKSSTTPAPTPLTPTPTPGPPQPTPLQHSPTTAPAPASSSSTTEMRRSTTTSSPHPNQSFTHPAMFTASRQSLSHPSSILCFHARNIPSISIEAYLQRILKYCPITNEVFLSLLVYFDRMSRSGYGTPSGIGGREVGLGNLGGAKELEPTMGMRGFAIDSYNVHRLVIAGITVASKFFSDVFYTNSRYAKVGGLPQSELNQLELQFLLLNDFRLVIPLDEMQRYADQLLVYWEGKTHSPPRTNGVAPFAHDTEQRTEKKGDSVMSAPTESVYETAEEGRSGEGSVSVRTGLGQEGAGTIIDGLEGVGGGSSPMRE